MQANELIFDKLDRNFVEKNYTKLLKAHNNQLLIRKNERTAKAINSKISKYNSKYANNYSSSNLKINIEIKPEQLSNKKVINEAKQLNEYLNKINKRPEGKRLITLKSKLSPLVKNFTGKIPDLSKSVNMITKEALNSQRKARGLLAAEDQVYYDNFLVAAVRIGAFKLYREAVTKGYDYVKKLLDRGFSIAEVYLSADNVASQQQFTYKFYTNEELNDLGFDLLNPSKFITDNLKDTAGGKDAMLRAKALLRL